MFDQYSNLARLAVMFARVEAGRVGATEIAPGHLLLGTIRVDPKTFLEISPTLTRDAVRERAATWQVDAARVPNNSDMPVSDDLKCVFEKATSLGAERKDPFLRTEHLLLALIAEPSHAADILTEADANSDRVEQMVRDRLGAGQQNADWSEQGDFAVEDRDELFS